MNSILKKLLYCISIGTSFLCPAQNLVPNPSFEEYVTCPESSGQLEHALNWFNPSQFGTPDYFNSCSQIVGTPFCCSGLSFQNPHYGNSYAGFWAYTDLQSNFREYVQTKLIKSLDVDKCYLVSIYINSINWSVYGIKNIGLYFSNNKVESIGTNYILNYSPQIQNKNIIYDTINWIKIEGVFKANGGENYLTIGNFYDDSITEAVFYAENNCKCAYYLIDDVSVIPIDSLNGMPAYAGADTIIAPGDSVFIGQEISNLNCTWRSLDGTILATNTSGLYVQPTETTTYVVEQNLCGTISYDTVKVYVGYLGLNRPAEALEVGIMPNPNAGSFTIRLAKPMTATKTLFIYDNSGKLVKKLSLSFENSPEKKLDTDLENGVYFFKLKDENTDEQLIKKITVLH